LLVDQFTNTGQKNLEALTYLVGGFKHSFYFPFHVWDVILPIDELHHFSRWSLHHQPLIFGPDFHWETFPRGQVNI
jgi:hypothetical protein